MRVLRGRNFAALAAALRPGFLLGPAQPAARRGGFRPGFLLGSQADDDELAYGMGDVFAGDDDELAAPAHGGDAALAALAREGAAQAFAPERGGASAPVRVLRGRNFAALAAALRPGFLLGPAQPAARRGGFRPGFLLGSQAGRKRRFDEGEREAERGSALLYDPLASPVRRIWARGSPMDVESVAERAGRIFQPARVGEAEEEAEGSGAMFLDPEGADGRIAPPAVRRDVVRPTDLHVLGGPVVDGVRTGAPSPCPRSCGAIVWLEEGGACCKGGKNILGEAFNPPIDAEYLALLQMPYMSEDSRHLNAMLAMATQGAPRPPERTVALALLPVGEDLPSHVRPAPHQQRPRQLQAPQEPPSESFWTLPRRTWGPTLHAASSTCASTSTSTTPRRGSSCPLMRCLA